MRGLTLFLLATLLVLIPASAEARQQTYTQNVWNNLSLPDSIEQDYDKLMNASSSLAGAPQNGRAQQNKNPARFEPASAFERYYTRTRNPMLISGSSRPIKYLPPMPNYTPQYRSPEIRMQSAPAGY